MASRTAVSKLMRELMFMRWIFILVRYRWFEAQASFAVRHPCYTSHSGFSSVCAEAARETTAARRSNYRTDCLNPPTCFNLYQYFHQTMSFGHRIIASRASFADLSRACCPSPLMGGRASSRAPMSSDLRRYLG